MHAQSLGDDIADGHARRQAAERILEHDLHPRPQAGAAPARPAGDDPVRRTRSRPADGFQPQGRKPSVVLPEPDLPDQPDGLAFAHRRATRRPPHAHGQRSGAARRGGSGNAPSHPRPAAAVAAPSGQRRRRALAAPRPAASACRDAPVRRTASATRSCLHHHAVLHHADAVGVAADDAQIMRDQQQRQPAAGLQPRQQPPGSAPGSSRPAPSSVRRRSAAPGRWRAPWRSSRAGAVRRRAGAETRPAGGRRRRSRPGRAASITRARSAARGNRRCSVIASATWRPMRCSGLRLVIGSWNTMPATPPRAWCSRPADRADDLLPVQA